MGEIFWTRVFAILGIGFLFVRVIREREDSEEELKTNSNEELGTFR